ncbi:MAG: transglycosylase domain-containing protein, partial [Bdellovibrionales bacterium]|nr:transglycosylase domain-containing protein [Bdellovibrionales bacterium]
RIEDYQPPAVSRVLSRDGTLIGEFFVERRYPVSIDEIPLHVRNAFLAAEDANFYSHPGIDVVSIFRAVVKNLKSRSASQGASTITQQVVKNLLLTSKKKLTRKIKEALLAYQIEQKLSKDEILQIYLNHIFFGNGAYGIKSAAQSYYHKELADLTIAEAALLAGLVKAPSRYSPLANPKLAFSRQRYVLGQMAEAGFITKEEAEAGREEELTFYPSHSSTLLEAPFYTTEVRRLFLEKFPALDLDEDGYTIETAVDVGASKLAVQALRDGVDAVDKRRGWRGPIDYFADAAPDTFLSKYGQESLSTSDFTKKYPALVTGNFGRTVSVLLGDRSTGEFVLADSSWANRRLSENGGVRGESLSSVLRVGDVVEVSLYRDEANKQQEIRRVRFDQTPEVEGALVLIEPSTGEVRALVGGYDYQRSQFNRATQSYRQPGSSFKPVVYLAAIDAFGYTPASIVYDEPRTFKVGDQYWTPGNFDESFLGPITLRNALEKSRNLVSADIISRIGVESAIHYARKLGIESPLGANLSLSLGSSEVTLLELARAYGVFANRGVLVPS